MHNMVMRFEWDESKRLANLEKHGIDFIRAKEIWLGDVLEVPSAQDDYGEKRYLAYGRLESRIIAVVYAWRGGARRIISARRARDYERDAYEDAFGRAPRG
jgi:uncharacterized DUF497 family protein